MKQINWHKISPELRSELKDIVRQELEKKGIYSKYRLDTAWGNILWEGRDLEFGDDLYLFVRKQSQKFIYEVWGPNGRINRLFED